MNLPYLSNMKFILPVFLVVYYSIPLAIGQQSRFEKSNGKETATYAEIVDWYRLMDKISVKVKVKETGITDAGYPLQVVMVSNDATFDPGEWHRRQKVVIFINNGIHPGEPDGIDASMQLVRDIAKGKISLPDNVALALIPVYNIGGCLNRNSTTRVNQNGPAEYGFRGNAQNLDLNRDFTKCDSREARIFPEIFHSLDPDIFIDNHVSDGADYQHTMTLITTQYDKLGPELGSWAKTDFEPALYRRMAGKGWDMIPYVDFEHTDIEKGMPMFYDPPRYSSGYAALFNTLSFIPETHMLKPYGQRVKSTFDLMVSFIEEAQQQAAILIQKRKAAVSATIYRQNFPLKWELSQSVHREIIFKGYEKDTTISEVTGLPRMFFNHSRPFTKKVSYFDTYLPLSEVKKPTAYLIPQGWRTVVELLQLNDVTVRRLEHDSLINVTAYQIEKYASYSKPYEKHHKNYNVQVTAISEKIAFLKGDYIILLDQPANRYLVEMLEPTGDDSFFAWNFFDAVLQQKEGYSDYRWEDIAASVVKNDPLLSEKLEKKKAAEPAFAANAGEILEYVYKHSPYYEKAHMRYPVFRIE